MTERIALIPIAARPFHAGHDALIRLAASERDRVVVLASGFVDRECVKGQTMRAIWNEHIIPNLPSNVSVSMVLVPVRDAYEMLGSWNEIEIEEATAPEVLVYGDAPDVRKNFPDKSLERYAGDLFVLGKVGRRPVERSSTVDVSGTQMRRWLEQDNYESFSNHLPEWMDKLAVWNILRSDMDQT